SERAYRRSCEAHQGLPGAGDGDLPPAHGTTSDQRECVNSQGYGCSAGAVAEYQENMGNFIRDVRR
ncbi:MAG: hypothetical protein ACE5JM_08195, partial [Armatimonadota bacterium]